MKINRRKLVARIVSLILLALLPLIPLMVAAQAGRTVITPQSSYTDPAWGQKAARHSASLNNIQRQLNSKYSADKLQFLTTADSNVGGIGFWGNPANFGGTQRYLCLFVRANVPPPSSGRAFPDTQTGRILTIMDAYGKNTISVLANELKTMSDPDIAGAAIIFIYGKKPVTDPAFEQDAEALALFVKTQDVMAFAQLRMTIQTLFSKSDMLPVLQGKDQIQNLRMYILQP